MSGAGSWPQALTSPTRAFSGVITEKITRTGHLTSTSTSTRLPFLDLFISDLSQQMITRVQLTWDRRKNNWDTCLYEPCSSFSIQMMIFSLTWDHCFLNYLYELCKMNMILMNFHILHPTDNGICHAKLFEVHPWNIFWDLYVCVCNWSAGRRNLSIMGFFRVARQRFPPTRLFLR